MNIAIDNAVPFTAFVCSRNSRPVTRQTPKIHRKFKSTCGAYILVGIDGAKVLSIDIDRISTACVKNCEACKNAIALAKKVIESGR